MDAVQRRSGEARTKSTSPETATTHCCCSASVRAAKCASATAAVVSTPFVPPATPHTAMISPAFPRITVGLNCSSSAMLLLLYGVAPAHRDRTHCNQHISMCAMPGG
jgi:hypothetical protein